MSAIDRLRSETTFVLGLLAHLSTDEIVKGGDLAPIIASVCDALQMCDDAIDESNQLAIRHAADLNATTALLLKRVEQLEAQAHGGPVR